MKQNKGFTLVELIIVLACLTGVLGFFWKILESSSKDAYTINDKMEVQNSVTSLMNAIQKDTQESRIILVSETDYGIFTAPLDSDKIYEDKRYEFGDGNNRKIYEFDAYNRTVTRTSIKGEDTETGEFNNIVGFSIKKTEKKSNYGAEVNIIGSKKSYTGGTPAEPSTSKIEVGSYIDYTGGDYTGKWVVLRNTPGQIEIISKESVGDLTLNGAEGYANCVKILNDKCKTYVNSTYATSGRSVGATSDSIGQINTTEYPLTFAAARTQTLPYHDEYYIADQTIIANNENLKHSDGSVWLAARILFTTNNSSFCVREINKNGEISIWSLAYLFRAYSDGTTFSTHQRTNGVRPVIMLKPGIKITGGNGTESSPYTIAIGGSGVAEESSNGIDKSRYTLNSTFYTRNTYIN